MPSFALMAARPVGVDDRTGPTRALGVANPDSVIGQQVTSPQPEVSLQWATLVARMRKRDTAAFESAMDLTREAGWRLACHSLGDAHLAQDVLQEAYLVVFTRIETLRDPSAFRSWFLRIVLNQCRNAVRGKQRETSVEEAPEAPGRNHFEEDVTRRLVLTRALDALTPLERTSVLLRDYLQLSYQEMSQVLQIPLGTVKSRLNEARKQLVRRLKGADAR